MTYACKTIDSPLGPLKVVASDKGLAAILWHDENAGILHSSPVENPGHPVLVETERQLRAYFAGKLRRFSLPLDFQGTAFQQSVWRALLTIPFGATRSYAEIARQIAGRRRSGRSARRTAGTRSRSWRPATASSARTAR
jgi:methylated-DNA-[protein]-cysteine S-methyltransferase